MLGVLFSRLQPSAHILAAHSMYESLVEQSRNPVFYTALQVQDTLDGRFDMVLLHVFLLMSRLQQEESLHAYVQPLMEVLIHDMDRSLRELGVADTGVKRRIKLMGQAFNGRLQNYQQHIHDEQAFESALARNVYRTEQPEQEQRTAIVHLKRYSVGALAALGEQSADQILAGQISWPDVA